MHISERSIHRPVTVMMGVLIVIILGIISLSRIPIDLYPKIEIPTVAVVASYSGVGPEEVKNLVTKPIEKAVATVAGIKSVRSVSREGASQVTIEFDYGMDMEAAITEIQQKVERARRQLPDDVDSPTVMKFDPNSAPVLTMAISSKLGPDELKTFVDDQIVPYIERVNGVASVTTSGGLEREIKILIDPDKIDQYEITLSEINQQLRNQNIDSPGGRVTEGGVTYTVRSLGKFASIDDIRNVSIPLKGGGKVFLSELAIVQEGYKEVTVENKLNDQNTVSISIMKQSGSNTVAVVDGIQAELDKLKSTSPIDFSILNISDQSKFIRASINTLVHDALIGGVLAILIILLFLKSISNTMIISLAIPISVIATFTLMFFSDMTINVMSLGGLTLGIGMIVDDAIVVLENIHRRMENGLSIREAAVEGTKEVAMPVIAATLTTVAVFFPIVYVEGLTAQLFKDLGVTVSIGLLASLIVSLTVTPMLATKLMKAKKPSGSETLDTQSTSEIRSLQSTHAAVSKNEPRWIAFYRRILSWSLGHRKTTILIAIVSLVASIALVPLLGMEMMPSSDQGQVNVSITLPTGTELEKTREVMTQAQTIVSEVPEVETIYSSLGSANATRFGNASSSSASFLLLLEDASKRKRSTAEIVEEIRNKLNRFPGARLRVSEAGGATLPGLGGGGQNSGGGNSPISYALRGNDQATLKEVAERLTDEISQLKGVREADNTLEDSRPEIQVSLDRVRAAALGITQSMVSSTVQTALNDQVATRYETGGRETDVTITLTNKSAATMDDIRNLSLFNSQGERVLVKDVAEVKIANGPQTIQRFNQARVVNVTAMLAPGQDLGSVSQEIDQLVRTFPLPPGYVIEAQGQNQQLQESQSGMLLAFGLAIILVYIILAAQFESLIYPLSIMLSVPLSFFGASFSLFITGRPLSVPAFIGIILLAGIVVRNAIVLIDFTNILRRQGVDRTEALLTAGPVRLRPILMTTLCTVLGLLPLAIGLGEGGESQAPMATVVIGGLLFSTLLTLVVIPVVYSILDDFSSRLRKVTNLFSFRKTKSVTIEK